MNKKTVHKNPTAVRYTYTRIRNGIIYQTHNLFTKEEMKHRCCVAKKIKETRNYLYRMIGELKTIYTNETIASIKR